MRLLCLLGGHRPGPSAIVHGAYRYAHCKRCDRDIIQSATSGWRLPAKGFRVVWPDAPASSGMQQGIPAARRPADDGNDWLWAASPGVPTTVTDPGDFMADLPERANTVPFAPIGERRRFP